MITSHLITNTIISNEEEAFALYEKSRFGEKKRNNIQYSWIESLYLMDTGRMHVHVKNKPITFEQLLAKAKKHDKRVETKYLAFHDLRKKGYIVKTALKFGADFRVYPKGVKPSEDHASWLLFPVREHETLTWYDFSAKNRVATSTNKKLLLAIDDDEDDVTYYECKWLRP